MSNLKNTPELLVHKTVLSPPATPNTSNDLKIALIACNNGYGHIRRICQVAKALQVQGAAVTIFAPVAAVRRFLHANEFDINPILVTDFETGNNSIMLDRAEPFSQSWLKMLPSLDSYSLVVSDNLPEILLLRPDAILSGHFFWHKLLSNDKNEYVQFCEKLLAKHRPRMIASGFFAAPYIDENSQLHEVGLFGQWARKRIQTPKKNLLISCGLTSNLNVKMAELIAHIVDMKSTSFNQVYVEPALLPLEHPDWMRPANFTMEMYNSLSAMICRPGIGTVTDGLLAGARIFCVYEAGNSELALNANRLEQANVGLDCARLENVSQTQKAYDEASKFANTPAIQAMHYKAVRKIKFGGELLSAKLLLSWAKEKS